MPEDRRFFIPDRSLPFSTSLIGVSYCTGKYHIKRKCSPFTVVEYVVDGEGYVKDGDVFRPAGKDQIYICPANAPHDYCSSSEKPWTKIWMNLYGNVPLILLHEYGLQGTVVADAKPLKPLFLELKELIHSEKANDECDSEILALFVRIVKGLYLLKDKIKAGNPEAAAMKMLLDGNVHRIVSNAELSAHIYRSPDYAVKLFKEAFSTTPYHYQLEQKMTVACRMLRQTDIRVAKLAETLGYSDAHYFSGVFKQKIGLSPKAYRKSAVK
ncbi:MAG: AraC family transcriptional regulator [Clostridia bacterium]|nr:AraC family transcriptional regulator [Clostridia bacterium]